jgi:6-phosphofructo-2-kinase / fructose-2,6-biphosphatase 2
MITKASKPLLVVVVVGLPARGKTFIAQRLCRYLKWLGFETKSFNVGDYRRQSFGSEQPHSFFDSSNQDASEARKQAAMNALKDLVAWLVNEEGHVAIYDATNSTRERRSMVRDYCRKYGIEVMFIESICNDEEVIKANIREVKVSSPDYAHTDSATAIEDFQARIAHYEKAYESVGEDEGPFVKHIDVGSQFIINQICGYLQSRIVYYVMNVHTTPRVIFITRVSLFGKTNRVYVDFVTFIYYFYSEI